MSSNDRGAAGYAHHRFLCQLAAKAAAENMVDLSESEIVRVFGDVVSYGRCMDAVRSWRDSGNTLDQLLDVKEII